MIGRPGWTFLLLPCLAFGQDAGVPSYVLMLPAAVETVLIAETDAAILHRYQAGDNRLRRRSSQPMSIGQNGVGKQRSGDRRTPLGVYFVVEEMDTSNLHRKYGPVAFPLDYPNAWDRANDRTGHGIWIHGVDPESGTRPVFDTDGCIALQNEDLLQLGDHLVPLHTPVIVTREIRRASPSEIAATRDALLAALQRWTASYRDGDWHQFLGMYADEFEYRGMNLEEWTSFRLLGIGDRPIEDFYIDEILLLEDPEEPGLFLSRFQQTIIEASGPVTMLKRLYWRRLDDGFRIVAEDNG